MLIPCASCFFIILFEFFCVACAVTHWILSDEGRIEAQYESIYSLKRPYDLQTLLNQEISADNVAGFYDEMVERKISLDKKWASLKPAVDMENQIVETDLDCNLAINSGENDDLFITIVDYASDEINDHYHKNSPKERNIKRDGSLDCKKYSRIDFSLPTFPHLQVLWSPWNLTWADENTIILPLTRKQIYYGLSKNKTNWYMYHLASLYWRSTGDIQKSLECVIRAIHFAPREYRDTPLFNLGMMLHRARCTAEAAIVLHAAVDHAPKKPLGHFILANVYAYLHDYYRSVACYNNAIGMDPKWNVVRAMKHYVICQSKVKEQLMVLAGKIKEVLEEIKLFKFYQEEWLRLREDLLNQQADPSNHTIQWILRTKSKCSKKCFKRRYHFELSSCEIKPILNLVGHNMDDDLISIHSALSVIETQADKISEIINTPYESYEPFLYDLTNITKAVEYVVPDYFETDEDLFSPMDGDY